MCLDVRVRPARLEDRAFVVDLAPRVAEPGRPDRRPPEEVAEGERRLARQVTEARPENAALLVAEGQDGTRHGYIYLTTVIDFFAGTEQGRVVSLVVTPESEGCGVGRALMEAGEAWARRRGYPSMILNVFTGNTRAGGFYECLGYVEETRTLFKAL